MSKHDPFAPSAAVKVGEVWPGEEPKSASKAKDKEPEAAPATGGDPAPAKEVLPDGAETPKAAGSDVPEGTVKEVLAWVGDDKEKAQQALDAENATGEPRKSLVAELEEKLA